MKEFEIITTCAIKPDGTIYIEDMEQYLEACKVVENKLKAFEIIKKKRVNANCIISGWQLDKYNGYRTHKSLTKKEYDLLNEVLK